MNFTIRKAVEQDIERVAEIYDAYLDYEAIHGTTTNWIKGVYPTIKNAQKAFEAGTLFVGELDGKVVGSYVLNHIQPDEYTKIQWEYPGEDDQVMVIHTLCIDVNYKKMGLGSKFVEFVFEHGRSLGCKTIRLDTYEMNRPAEALYKKMGFRYAGMAEFFFEQAIWENLICFEYSLV